LKKTSDKELLAKTLGECASRLPGNPNPIPLRIVKEEIEYLLELVEGKTDDKSHLKEIQIGLLAVREFEADDPEFADLIFQISDLVQRLKDSS